jgi:hypothetical protein
MVFTRDLFISKAIRMVLRSPFEARREIIAKSCITQRDRIVVFKKKNRYSIVKYQRRGHSALPFFCRFHSNR